MFVQVSIASCTHALYPDSDWIDGYCCCCWKVSQDLFDSGLVAETVYIPLLNCSERSLIALGSSCLLNCCYYWSRNTCICVKSVQCVGMCPFDQSKVFFMYLQQVVCDKHKQDSHRNKELLCQVSNKRRKHKSTRATHNRNWAPYKLRIDT